MWFFSPECFFSLPSYDRTYREIQYKGSQSGLKSYEINTTSESEEKDSILYTYVDLHLLFSFGRHLCSLYEHVPEYLGGQKLTKLRAEPALNHSI
jgi:hypothetical protein